MHRVGFIAGYQGSYVLAASSLPPTSAVIFVHGFAGDALSTWQHVQELIDVPPYAAALHSTDIFFYDYECARYDIPYSSDELNKFITQILKDRASRDGIVPYHAVRLVGHSAGAVVIRQLLFELLKHTHESPYRQLLIDANPLVLASAQGGFKHGVPVMLALGRIPFLDVAVALWMVSRGNVYDDLQPESRILTTIDDQTKDLWASGHVPALRALTVWAKGDHIVNKVDFLRDVPITYKLGCDHSSICKPNDGDTDVLDWIVDAMRVIPLYAPPQ